MRLCQESSIPEVSYLIRAALVCGNHMVHPARICHIRTKALQLRIRYAGEELHARRLQSANKLSRFNHLPPSFPARHDTYCNMCSTPRMPWGQSPSCNIQSAANSASSAISAFQIASCQRSAHAPSLAFSRQFLTLLPPCQVLPSYGRCVYACQWHSYLRPF